MPMVNGKEYPYTKKGKAKDILKGRGVQGMMGGGYVEDDRVKMGHGGDPKTEAAKQSKGNKKMMCRGMGAMVKGGSFTIS